MAINLDKVLITGANGMVGSYVDFGIKTDKRSMDIIDLKEVLAVCRKYNPEAIIHLAAETDQEKCEKEPERAYLVNGVGTYNIAIAAKELGVKLIYVSTIGIFDGEKKEPYTEEDEPNPQNYYGHSKYLGELVVKGMLKDYIIARINWVFGGGPDRDNGMVKKITKQFNQSDIKAVVDKIGSPTFAKDFIIVIKQLLLSGEKGIFHLNNEGICSGYEFIREIVNILKPDIKVIPVDSSFFNLDAKRMANKGAVSKIKLMRPWQDALKEYLETEWKPFLK